MSGKKLKNKSAKGQVIWLTGLPCSGKTTLAMEVEKFFIDRELPVQILDGDVMRRTISSDLGFSKKDRDENIRRMSYIAKMLSNNGVNVILAFVAPYERMRKFARSVCNNYIEVFIDCSLEECKKRDIKGMYKKAIAGKIRNFTGVDDPFEKPNNFDITVNTEKEAVGRSSKRITDFLKKKLG